MTRTTFDNIWEIIYISKVNKIKREFKNIVYKEHITKDFIWKEYESLKGIVHTYLYNPNGLIDRHKVASIFTEIILRIRPFDILPTTDEKIQGKSFLVNEILALQCALGILYSFIITKARENNDGETEEIFRKGFIYPECDHDKYTNYLFQMLYYSHINKRFDIFCFCNLLFMIEEFTRISHISRKLSYIAGQNGKHHK